MITNLVFVRNLHKNSLKKTNESREQLTSHADLIFLYFARHTVTATS
jgi:hypothetical protein